MKFRLKKSTRCMRISKKRLVEEKKIKKTKKID